VPVSSPPKTFYPPRADRIWVGRRAATGARIVRLRHRVFQASWWLFTALVPGLPWWLHRQRGIGMAVFVGWGLVLALYLALRNLGFQYTVRSRAFMVGTIQYEPVYLVLGLAAGIHIASTVHLLCRVALPRFRRESRVAAAVGMSVAVAAFVYFAMYAPLANL
jgi:hypothetical protein